MKPASEWTADEREFDRILNLMESPRQMARIEGRADWPKFEARFTKEQLEEMAEAIGARKR